MIRCLTTIFLVLLAVSAALAQEKKTVPPPPKPSDDGPSLEATMKFIQDKLNDIGPVNHTAYCHDNAVGDYWTNRFKSESTRVVAASSSCQISYHRKEETDGAVTKDVDPQFLLRDVQDVAVMLREQELKEGATVSGHPEWTCKVDPPVFVLKVRRTDKLINAFDFYDEQMANRVAKAMVRAVELCGGGDKPEPF
jgi:hypothetical protein